jgi:hypothetical protein
MTRKQAERASPHHATGDEGLCKAVEQNEVNPRDVLEQLTVHHAQLRWSPVPPSAGLADWEGNTTRSTEALAYLHAHHQLPATPQDSSGGGRMTRLFGRLTFKVLRRRLDEEQALFSNLVQMTEVLAQRCDDMAAVIAAHQVNEAANQAQLAGWLDAALPNTSPSND